MNVLSTTLKNTQRKIQELEKQQDVIYKQTLKALNLKINSKEADYVFDYLYNKFGSTTEILKKTCHKVVTRSDSHEDILGDQIGCAECWEKFTYAIGGIMGRGYIAKKNAMKKTYMEPLKKYAEQLEKENYALKNDPDSLIGEFIGQYRELQSQNSRLSVLCAALIRKLGESVLLTKDEIEAYQQKRINIKWEVPDGTTLQTAQEYTFSYELQDISKDSAPPTSEPECTDPSCTLPKDLKHTHTVDPTPPEKAFIHVESPDSDIHTDERQLRSAIPLFQGGLAT